MAAHQHNYSSLRYPGWSLDEGQVLYSNARRGGASEHEPKGRRGCRTPEGPTEEEVEGCRLTVGTRDAVGGIPGSQTMEGQPRGHGNVPLTGLPTRRQRKLRRLASPL